MAIGPTDPYSITVTFSYTHAHSSPHFYAYAQPESDAIPFTVAHSHTYANTDSVTYPDIHQRRSLRSAAERSPEGGPL